jgi:hypothetical protein
MIRHRGGVAQLGEHLLCKQGVTGSIPVVSMSVAHISGQASVVRLRRWWTEGSAGAEAKRYRGVFEFGGRHCLDTVFRVAACAVMVVFVSVNQVLVRLWTRVPCQWPGASHRGSDVCPAPGD